MSISNIKGLYFIYTWYFSRSDIISNLDMENSKRADYSLVPEVWREKIHLFTIQSNSELEQLIIVEYE